MIHSGLIAELGLSLPEPCDPAYIETAGREQHLPIEGFPRESRYSAPLSPEEFFCFVRQQEREEDGIDYTVEGFARKYAHLHSLQELIDRMCARLPVDRALVWVNATEDRIQTHEGRHRAAAAWLLGIDRVPTTFIVLIRSFRGEPLKEVGAALRDIKVEEMRRFHSIVRGCTEAPPMLRWAAAERAVVREGARGAQAPSGTRRASVPVVVEEVRGE